ncbi:hypothetical protein NQ095_13100 [Rossellomorea sp. SC111]|uniref:hypothetical protein n=1 Tax=Rossellomorea sp. SC111 TaxID=2968985 RepID=UPI00215AD2C6|nr:hypothetical protein [Rossellomorea sp. SC111]MCR8849352.1 hypothetical protein [Rossellomorea sp. SC111]
MNKRKILFLAGGLMLVGILIFFWMYVGKADSRPEDKKMISRINSTQENVEAIEIQDFLKVDARHGVAPFRSDRGDYGISYWEWNITGWKVKSIRTDGEPRVWMVDRGDPSSFRIVWNINPDQVSILQYYFLRERGYSMSADQQHYVPSILMKMEVSTEGKSYGVKKLPREWVLAMKLSDGSKGTGLSFGEEFNLGLHSRFGWLPLDENEEEAGFSDISNNSSYSHGNVREEFMQPLSKKQLERGQF